MTGIILAARHNSKRLSQKATLKILDKTILEIAILRLRQSKVANDVILATTESSYPHFKDIIKNLSVKYFVGSENDVLLRYTMAAERFGLKTIIRATGDNPLVSISALDSIVEHHRNTNADLSHYKNLPYGSGIEVIEYEAFKKANEKSHDDFCHEHITQYHYQNKNMFKIETPDAPTKWSMPDLRTTVDTEKDYNYVKAIFEKYNDIYVEIDKIIADYQ